MEESNGTEGSNGRNEREGTGRKEIRKEIMEGRKGKERKGTYIRKERKEVMEWKEVMQGRNGRERDGRK